MNLLIYFLVHVRWLILLESLFQAFYSACDDKGKAEDMTRVNPSPVKGKQGADERSSDKVTGEDKNPSEDTETISSSSGSVAPMKDEAAISRFLDDVLCSTDSND